MTYHVDPPAGIKFCWFVVVGSDVQLGDTLFVLTILRLAVLYVVVADDDPVYRELNRMS